ncbi:hypothetical protein Q2E61_00595 [Microbulbifer thermotolerans]|uniref:hypothetical protein n=1 Tax=Microbulbifer thermotolerans TaxID=252514 RepID=UPI0026731CCD|nr:hypothetical protein [Microbulbifer thermotolerans]WKT60728.1 hypothetical protein Q2E61_00595 [Microbulbifer thermotolerans]
MPKAHLSQVLNYSYLKEGFLPVWFWLIISISMALLFCWYISPVRNKEPTKIQKIVAITWIVFRRVISFTGALFGILCIYILLSSTGTIIEKILGSIVILCLSLFFIYVGIVGQGRNQYDFRDDLSLYAKIKEKYGIRW